MSALEVGSIRRAATVCSKARSRYLASGSLVVGAGGWASCCGHDVLPLSADDPGVLSPAAAGPPRTTRDHQQGNGELPDACAHALLQLRRRRHLQQSPDQEPQHQVAQPADRLTRSSR